MIYQINKKIRALAPMLALMLLSNCGGRAAHPVQVVQSEDETLSCAYLKEFVSGINKQIASHVKAKDHRDANNAGLILMYGPSGALINDATNTEETEIQAWVNRNKHLVGIMKSKECTDIPITAAVDGNPDVEENVKKAIESGEEPNCGDVGGWENYHEKTGKSCRL